MPNTAVPNILFRGDEKLAKYENFKLVGRSEQLKSLFSILMRSQSNSVLLVGPGGVGCSALCLGLHTSKKETDTPFDIVSKRFFWLDTDGLFSSGNSETINTSFQKALDILYRTPDSVLIIDDIRGFIEAARNTGTTHFINALILAVRNNKTQIILETSDDDLEVVLKCHSEIRECCTLMDLEEPSGDDLVEIVTHAAESLAKYHCIRINPDAIKATIELTNKYRPRDPGLSRAQPERSITLLDRAFSSYRLAAHEKPLDLRALEAQCDKTTDAKEKAKITAEILGLREAWQHRQKQIKHAYKYQREGEISLINLEIELKEQQEKEEKARLSVTNDAQEVKNIASFSGLASRGGFDSPEVKEIKARIKEFEAVIAENKAKYDVLTNEINNELEMTRDMVLEEFSRISGIPVHKLNENEREKLRELDATLRKRIFGQDHVVEQVSNGVRVAKIGRKTGSPLSYLFLGPSGVGKTEMAKALAEALYDDERSLTRFDMSEYMEKHAVAKLIGAPPGYEGYEAGGILTNAMRKVPTRVLLYDEIEKAHPDVFNVFLQILDDGRLTDNVGRTVSFGEAVQIFTTNLGQEFFLDPSLTFAQAMELALEKLGETYRSEFLNRFNGRENIICFHSLNLDSMQRIVRREISRIDLYYREQGIITEISDADIQAFCHDKYNPARGARGLPGVIKVSLEPFIVNHLLANPNGKGKLNVSYDAEHKKFILSLLETSK